MFGWHLYSGDFNDQICKSGGLHTLIDRDRTNKKYGPNQQWCMGTMHTAPSWTNTILIRDSELLGNNPASINDGWFAVNAPTSRDWVDYPTSYHNKAGAFRLPMAIQKSGSERTRQS